MKQFNDIEHVFDEVCKAAYGIDVDSGPYQDLVFNVLHYQVLHDTNNRVIPQVETEEIKDRTGRVLFKEPVYSRDKVVEPPRPSARVMNPPVLKHNGVSFAGDFSFRVNGQKFEFSIGVQESVSSNGSGKTFTTKRVPSNARIVVNPSYQVKSLRANKLLAAALLFCTGCEDSPLYWTEEKKALTGINFTEVNSRTPKSYRCVTLAGIEKDITKNKQDVDMAQFISLLAGHFNDRVKFAHLCKALDINVPEGPNAYTSVFVDMTQNLSKDAEWRKNVLMKMVDFKQDAYAWVQMALNSRAVVEEDGVFKWGFGDKGVICTEPGVTSLVDKVSSNLTLYALLQSAVNDRGRVEASIDAINDKYKKYLLPVFKAVELGVAVENGEQDITSGFIKLSGSQWVTSKDELIHDIGMNKTREEAFDLLVSKIKNMIKGKLMTLEASTDEVRDAKIIEMVEKKIGLRL